MASAIAGRPTGPRKNHRYTRAFFERQGEGSRRSAEEIVPLLSELVPARSVVDVGCGIGHWLAEFQHRGVEDVLGLDGAYVDRALLRIPERNFRPHDLRTAYLSDRRFDLALCLEVAEHLPPHLAESFVEGLTALAPVVAFSAAVPHQGGTDHLNERWPDYWAQVFARHDYLAVDCLRLRLWHNERVEWWYAQNLLLFVRREELASYPALKAAATGEQPLALIHPRNYLRRVSAAAARDLSNLGLRNTAALLPVLLRRALERRLGVTWARFGRWRSRA